MALCNAHDAHTLVSAMYTPDAIYYNHSGVVRGTEDIARTYSYMNRTSYQLTLTPLAVEVVSGKVALEIGQCSGSYNGKYVIVWVKTGEGWQVLLDSNV